MPDEEKYDAEALHVEDQEQEVQAEAEVDTEAEQQPTETKEAAPEPQIPLSRLKELARQYGVEADEFAQLDDPEAAVTRLMQQYRGYRMAHEKARFQLPQTQPPATPAAGGEDFVDKFFQNPQETLRETMQSMIPPAVAAYNLQRMAVEEDQKIEQWANEQPANEAAIYMPAVRMDPHLQSKLMQGQIVTLADFTGAYNRVKNAHELNAKAIREQGLKDGATAAGKKRAAAVAGATKTAGPQTIPTPEELIKKYGEGNVPLDEMDRSIDAHSSEEPGG